MDLEGFSRRPRPLWMGRWFPRASRRKSHPAVKAGGTDPATNPVLRRTIQNARASTCRKTDRGGDHSARGDGRRQLPAGAVRGLAPHGVDCWWKRHDNPTRTSRRCANLVTKGGGNLATRQSQASCSQDGRVRMNPAGIARTISECNSSTRTRRVVEEAPARRASPSW